MNNEVLAKKKKKKKKKKNQVNKFILVSML